MGQRGRDRAGAAGRKVETGPLLPTVLRVSLVYDAGLIFPPQQWTDDAALGTVGLIIWLRAVKYLESSGGRMVVIERDPRQDLESVREFALTAADVDRILDALGAAGLPADEPRIDTQLDTSDRWAHLTLHVGTLKHRRTVDIDINTSSYSGEDAPALQELFQILLRLAGAGDPGVWYDLTGRWRQ